MGEVATKANGDKALQAAEGVAGVRVAEVVHPSRHQRIDLGHEVLRTDPLGKRGADFVSRQIVVALAHTSRFVERQANLLLLRYRLKPVHNVYDLETRLFSSYPITPPETRVLCSLQ